MNVIWFWTNIYEQMLFIFPLLLRCLQFSLCVRRYTSPNADFAEVCYVET